MSSEKLLYKTPLPPFGSFFSLGSVSLLLSFSSPLRFYLAFGRDFIVLVVVLKGMYSLFFIFVFFYFNYDYFFWCSLFCVLFVDKILNSTHY
jgi:hypothetical protein